MARPITSFKCLTLDCYGTLIDWESGIFHALQPLTNRLPPSHPLKHSRTALLRAFTRHEGSVQAAQPALLYRDVLASAYAALAAELHDPCSSADHLSYSPTSLSSANSPSPPSRPSSTPGPMSASHPEAVAFGLSVGQWPVFPDTVASMRRLRRHFQLVVLSNVDRASFAQTRALLRDAPLDGVCLAEDIGSYKPDLRNFRFVIAHCAGRGVASADILHTAQSLKHDHEPAKQVGLASAWIARGATPPLASRGAVGGEQGKEGKEGKEQQQQQQQFESVMGGDEAAYEGKVDISWRFGSLQEMADYVDAEAARLAGAR